MGIASGTLSQDNKTIRENQLPQRSFSLRPLFATSHYESIPKGRVHCEDGACVCLGHQPDEEVVLPHVDVSIDGTRESEVVL